jgi:hypothetical protein
MTDSGVGLAFPCGRGFITLLEAFRATGGTAPQEVLAPLLEEHKLSSASSLAKLLYSGQIFCFPWRSSHWVPMFQFDACDLAVNDGAQKVRAALPSLWTGWALASWFATPNANLEGSAPVDRLDADLVEVICAARSHISIDEHSMTPA